MPVALRASLDVEVRRSYPSVCDRVHSYFSSIDTLRAIEEVYTIPVGYSNGRDLHGIWVPDDSIVFNNVAVLEKSVLGCKVALNPGPKELSTEIFQKLELLDAISQKSPEAIEAFCKCHEDELVRDVPFMVWRYYRKAS